MIKNYGIKMAQQIKYENPKMKDLYRFLIIKELNRTYKYPEAVILYNTFKLSFVGILSFRF
jgi:hypothetical protein